MGDPGICVMSYIVNSKRTTGADVMRTFSELCSVFLLKEIAFLTLLYKVHFMCKKQENMLSVLIVKSWHSSCLFPSSLYCALYFHILVLFGQAVVYCNLCVFGL